jgi:rhamnulokinase
MTTPLYIAVDLGAGSGRVFLAGTGPGEFLLEEIHRFTYPPKEVCGRLRWNFALIFEEIKHGLRTAGVRAGKLGRKIHSIGVDSWGVDYGLVDSEGELIADPVCYRDDRTLGVMERVFQKVPRSGIFEKTGIQFMNFNTLFQLYSGDEDVRKAGNLLLMPDLINFFLTGKAAAEYTNATTTQMVNAATGDWDRELIGALDLPARVLPRIIPAGTDLGEMKPEIASDLGLSGVRVIAPATHDTGSAVAGAPLQENWAYVSSGTWSLIGVERGEALINKAVERHNFTNEGGAYGAFRFLKNVMGLWILEACRREWKAAWLDVEYDTLLREMGNVREFQAFIFPDDERFLNPPSMIEAIRAQLIETGQEFDDAPASLSRIIFDSLALRYASVLRTIESLTGAKVEGIQIVGGGGRNRYLNQMTANASGLKIAAGPVEATVIGNVLVQAISAGRFASLDEARQHVRENFDFEEFEPVESPEITEARERYAAIESRFLEH